MGAANAKIISHSLPRNVMGLANEKFKSEEIKVLERTFQDLAQRSPGKTIDKLTFLKVFNLPGVLGERLFAAFDRKKNGVIDLEEFVGGLGLIVRGDINDKIDFLFTMYDMQGDGVISRLELATMLNSVVFAAYTIVEASANYDSSQGVDEKMSPKTMHELHAKVDDLVQSAFQNKSSTEAPCDDQTRLSKEEFRSWIIEHGEALDIVESLLTLSRHPNASKRQSLRIDTSFQSEKMTFADIVNSPASPAIANRERIAYQFVQKRQSECPPSIMCNRCQYEIRCFFCNTCGSAASNDWICSNCGPIFKGGKLTFCISCGYDLRLNDKPLEPAYCRNSARDVQQFGRGDCQMEGWLFKVGSLFKNVKARWFVLKDHFLYSFRHERSPRPTGVIYLEGCFVDKVDNSRKNSKLKYGIEILISEEQNLRRHFYTKSESIQNAWISAIRKGARQYAVEDYYDIGRELGVGKFSSVHAALHKATGKKYAIKIIDKMSMDKEEREALRTEIAVLQLVNHPHVIHLKNVFESKSRIYIVTTLVEGGDLFDRIVKRHRFSEDTSRAIISQILQAIGYLHARGIVHRDLKPENIMMTYLHRDDHIQVGDFGLSKFSAPEEIMKLPCGTLAYVAPEVLQMKGYGRQVDLWSIGVILFVLLRGKLPFDSKNRSEVIAKTLKGYLPIERDPLWKSISDPAIDLVRKLLDPDPKRRLTVQKALNHEWITGVKESNFYESDDDQKSMALLKGDFNELLARNDVSTSLDHDDDLGVIAEVGSSTDSSGRASFKSHIEFVDPAAITHESMDT